MPATDRFGNPLSASAPAGVEAYDHAVEVLVRFGNDVAEAWDATIADDPGFVMGQVGRAHLLCMSSESAAAAEARDILDRLGTPARATDRERMHLRACRAYAAGDLHGARDQLARLTAEHPRDVLALAVGHQLDFFCGDAWALRDRIGRVLHAWDTGDPMYGFLLGMAAFGLEESGHYERAEDAARQALDTNAEDVWAHHALAHTYEMRGRADDGLALMDDRRVHWTPGNFLVVHNSWHEALFRLDLGDTDGALAIHDGVLHHAGSENIALELLDAASLLWRMHLEGIEVSDRWTPLARAWAETLAEPWYVFNDVHAVMAHVAVGDLDAARRIEARLAAYAAEPDPNEANREMTRDVGLAVTAALIAFGEQRYDRTVELLHPIRTRTARFGGSHAQRDVFARTLLEAARRSGDGALARALVAERLSNAPDSPYARHQLSRTAGV